MESSNDTESLEGPFVPFVDLWEGRGAALEKAPRAPLVELLPRDAGVLVSNSDMLWVMPSSRTDREGGDV